MKLCSLDMLLAAEGGREEVGLLRTRSVCGRDGRPRSGQGTSGRSPGCALEIKLGRIFLKPRLLAVRSSMPDAC